MTNLYIKNGVVIAWHDDTEAVPASDYGSGVRVIGGSPPQKIGDPAPQVSNDTLLAYAASKRWETETGGITINGVKVATDDRSKLMIMGAYAAAQANPNYTTQWVGSDGVAATLDATQVIAMGNAVQAHVAKCFATYVGIQAAIPAGTTTTYDQVDAAFAVITS